MPQSLPMLHILMVLKIGLIVFKNRFKFQNIIFFFWDLLDN